MDQKQKIMDARDKLAKKFGGVKTRIGGKGTQKRKLKVADKGNASSSKKLKNIEKKLNVVPMPDIAELNLFKNDGTILQFQNTTIKGSMQHQVFVVSQQPEEKNLKDHFAEFISQMDANEIKTLGEAHKDSLPKNPEAKEEEKKEEEAPELVDFEEVADN